MQQVVSVRLQAELLATSNYSQIFIAAEAMHVHTGFLFETSSASNKLVGPIEIRSNCLDVGLGLGQASDGDVGQPWP